MHTTVGRRVRWALLAVVSALVVAALVGACAPPASGGGSGGGTPLQRWSPHLTDPALPPDTDRPNTSKMPTVAPRGELAVVLNGTGADPLALTKLQRVLSDNGYHVVGLRYSSALGTRAACPDSVAESWPECQREFRNEVVFGAGVTAPDGTVSDHPGLAVDATRSVHNRLLKLIAYLHQRFPLNGWNQFQLTDGSGCELVHPVHGACELDWSKVTLVGHSQGAGVGLYLSKQFDVGRVAMLAGTADVFRVDGERIVAPWIAEGGFETDRADITSLVHTGDPDVGDHRAVAEALDLPGVEISTTLIPRPYFGSRRLSTSLAPACVIGTGLAHNSVATDPCVRNELFQVWEYMVTGD
jgi:hypothetical protein